jgi:DNA-binding response OmpR family regulator
LTPREFGVLEFLMRNEDVVVSKAEILRNVWDAHYQGADNVVEVYVGYLRRKVDVPFGTNTIETVRGVGYRLLPAVLTAGSLTLNPVEQTVQRGLAPISLSPREYAMLEYLMRKKGVVVTKAEILRNVWDAHDDGPENVVEVYVGYLRRKIDTPFGTATIETVRGAGYRLVG